MLRDYNIENDPGLRTDEDFIFNIRSFTKAKITVIVDEPLYEYTHRNNSLAHAFFKENISQYIDNRNSRVQVTLKEVQNETKIVKEWSTIHIMMYYNELLGKVALFPEYYSDERIRKILRFIRGNKQILNKYYSQCGFSKTGKFLILYLPNYIYMKYRKTKI